MLDSHRMIVYTVQLPNDKPAFSISNYRQTRLFSGRSFININ